MNSFRDLPSVDQVLRKVRNMGNLPHALVAEEVRTVLAERRSGMVAGKENADGPVEREIETRLTKLLEPSLRSVINASGVILHTNLGRAPLGDFKPISGYSNLEYDLEIGKRGKRDAHTATLLRRLLGAPAIVVNNNAAAVFLVLHELSAGYEVIVSRGELIEIGDGFRIPEIMARSGAVLREVGTTNRTRIDDYREALGERTRLILRVHPSNFHVSGFTAKPKLEELAQLGRERGVAVYEDLGSGCLVNLSAKGVNEPLVSDSLRAGINIVSFSCDKLLGGPQSGIVAGDSDLVRRIRGNPLYRALRVDKLIVEVLETTLRHLLRGNWSAIPTLRMIFVTRDEIYEKAKRVANRLGMLEVAIRESESTIGGGSTPDQKLPTWVVELNVQHAAAFEQRLRSATIPVIARVERDKIVLDMRTVLADEEESLVDSVIAAIG